VDCGCSSLKIFKEKIYRLEFDKIKEVIPDIILNKINMFSHASTSLSKGTDIWLYKIDILLESLIHIFTTILIISTSTPKHKATFEGRHKDYKYSIATIVVLTKH
jgi:hypothetical protein